MDWQFFTIIATIVASYYMIRRDIKVDMLQIQTFHREDLRAMDDRMGKIDEKFDARYLAIEEKWERLFEKLLVNK